MRFIASNMAYFGQISAKEHYVLRMILQLAMRYEKHIPVSLKTINEKEQISLKYLEQLIRPFIQAGWIQARRGRSGGYIMIKDPRSISLRDLIAVIEERPYVVECMDSQEKHRCSLEVHCLSKRAWQRVQHAIDDALKGISLSSLLEQ